MGPEQPSRGPERPRHAHKVKELQVTGGRSRMTRADGRLMLHRQGERMNGSSLTIPP